MKTFREFNESAAIARGALRLLKSASKAGRTTRTADGGRRVTSAARASRNVRPSALAPKGPPKNKYSSLQDYKDTNSDLSAFKRAGFRANKQDIKARYNLGLNYPTYPSRSMDPSPQNSMSKDSGSLYSTLISKHKNQATYAQRQLKDKVGYERDKTGDLKKLARPTAQRAFFLKQLKGQMGGTRTPKPVADLEIATGDYYRKNDPEDLIGRGKEFVQTLKSVPDKLYNAGVKPGSKVTGHPAAVMPGELDKVKGREKRGKLYKKIAGSRMTKMNPVTQTLVGTMQ